MKKTKMLKKNYEFRTVLNKGEYYYGKYITASVRKNNKNINFLGIAISSKIGKAVKRNHIKRLIREAYKNEEERIKAGNTIVFLWNKHKDSKNVYYKNIEKDVKKIFSDAKIFIEE